jgi:cytochrome c oxidase subunit 2
LAAAAMAPALAWANDNEWTAAPHRWQLNMGRGATSTAQIAYESHMIVFGICVVIGIIVFGAMAYAMFKFRKSKGAVPAQFTHNIKAEIVWTTIPVLILIGLAWPATRNLIRMYDTRNAEMTVKVTGYQWMWKYEYLGEGVSYTSRLARRSDDIRQTGQSPDASVDANYLLEVDHPLVLPVGTKVRFVVTADDVIHAWWVPALGWKQDAIPGIVNEAWASIDQPGTYRGQCAELCGKDHGFMPVVVKAVPKAEFAQWLAAEKAKNAPAPAATPAPAQPAEQQPAEQPAATATTEAAPNAQAAPAAATAG